MNFTEWQNTRTGLCDIGMTLDAEEHDGMVGYVYAGACWIEVTIKDDRPTFSSIVGNGEYSSPQLAEVENWLWHSWAESEVNSNEPDENEKEFRRRVRNTAQDCFWQGVVMCFPNAQTGVLPPEAVRAFDDACDEAIRVWIETNATNTTVAVPKGMRALRFGFDDIGPFNGFTDDTHWNGWLNVWLTPEEHESVIQRFNDEDFDADSMSDMLGMKPDENGLISYAMGYTTTEWTAEDDENARAREKKA